MPEQQSVAVALERLQGTMATGFAETAGGLALLVQRSDQTDARMDQADRKQDQTEIRVTALERRVWTAAGAAIVLGMGGGAGIAQILGR